MTELVSLFVGGVQKGGTTSLHAYLVGHPSLSPPARKELHFFDDELRDWANPNYRALHASFENHTTRLRFDCTPIYIFWPESIERIKAYNSNARFIILFRDPIERAFSHWCMEYGRGDEALPFSWAIREGRNRMDGLAPNASQRRIFSYVERGLYAKQLRRLLAHFPRQQLLFLKSEDLMGPHIETLATIANFLNVPAFSATGPKREHRRPEPLRGLAPSQDDIDYLADQFRDDLVQFTQLSGLDVANWTTMRACRAKPQSAMGGS